MGKKLIAGVILAACCVMCCGCTKTVHAQQATSGGFAWYSSDDIEIIDGNGWFWACPKCGKHDNCSDGQKYAAKQCAQCGEQYNIKYDG